MQVKTPSNVEVKVLNFVNKTGKGFVLNSVPFVARGFIVEVLKRYNFGLNDVIQMVNANEVLWTRLEPGDYAMIQNVVVKVGGNLSWFTPEFFIDSIRRSFPSVASLFLSDKKSMVWLINQVNIAKVNIEKLKAEGSKHA